MLWNDASLVAYENATEQDFYNFDLKLAQVLERFFTFGTWKSCWRRTTLRVYADETHGALLTLPRGFETCEQFQPACIEKAPIYSRFHEFAGFCCLTSNGQNRRGWIPCESGLKLYSDSAQTFRIPEGTFTLKIYGTETLSGQIKFSGGLDQNGVELFSTETLTITSGPTSGSQEFTQLPFIQKTVTTNPVYLVAVDVDTSEESAIGVYAPGETIPEYRQYLISAGADGDSVNCICKLKLVIPTSQNDIVVPNNIGALKQGLKALQYEEKSDQERAGRAWGPNYPRDNPGVLAGAIDLLDAELESLSEAEIPQFNMVEYGAGTVVNVI
jgi:hypothetical protein